MQLRHLVLLLLAAPCFAFAEDSMSLPDPSLPAPDSSVASGLPPPEANPDPNLVAPKPDQGISTVQPAIHAQESPQVEQLPISTKSSDLLDKRLAHEERINESETIRDREELVMHEGGHYQFAVDGAVKAFSNYDFDPTNGINSLSTNGIVIQALYFPWVETLGRLGLGPTVGLYQTAKDTTYTTKNPTFSTYGAELQYAAQYGIGQVVVPFGLAGYESVTRKAYTYHASSTVDTTVASESFSRAYAGGGLQIYLNRAERRVAARAMMETGIKKYYLSLAWKQSASKGRDGNLLLGLRFEF